MIPHLVACAKSVVCKAFYCVTYCVTSYKKFVLQFTKSPETLPLSLKSLLPLPAQLGRGSCVEIDIGTGGLLCY
jgi:hypothetical protein